MDCVTKEVEEQEQKQKEKNNHLQAEKTKAIQKKSNVISKEIKKLKRFFILQQQQEQNQQLLIEKQFGVKNIFLIKEDSQYLIYGGMYLTLNFMKDEENPMRDNGYNIKKIEYCEEKGSVSLYLKEKQDNILEIKDIIRQAFSVNDSKYYFMLGESLKEYQKQIHQELKQKIKYVQYLQDNNKTREYQYLYKQFKEWAINKIRELEGNNLYFTFHILNISLKHCEVNICISGYSAAFLKLRGVDLKNINSSFQGKVRCFFNKESSFNFFLNLLKTTIYQPQIPSTSYLLTFDELQIPFESTELRFNNRDHDYPYYKDQLQQPEGIEIPDFQLNIRTFKFEEKELQKVEKIRNKRGKWENMYYENFENHSKTLTFLQKYYSDRNKKCGCNCCNGEKDDILMDSL